MTRAADDQPGNDGVHDDVASPEALQQLEFERLGTYGGAHLGLAWSETGPLSQRLDVSGEFSETGDSCVPGEFLEIKVSSLVVLFAALVWGAAWINRRRYFTM